MTLAKKKSLLTTIDDDDGRTEKSLLLFLLLIDTYYNPLSFSLFCMRRTGFAKCIGSDIICRRTKVCQLSISKSDEPKKPGVRNEPVAAAEASMAQEVFAHRYRATHTISRATGKFRTHKKFQNRQRRMSLVCRAPKTDAPLPPNLTRQNPRVSQRNFCMMDLLPLPSPFFGPGRASS